MTPSNNVAILTLAKFLSEKLPGMKILTEWPDPKEVLALPFLSIITRGTPVYFHNYKTIVKVVDIPESDNKTVVYKVGHYDSNIQIDLWADYKSTRAELYDLVMAAFDSQWLESEQSTGLSLELVDYHNTFARYDQSGYTYMDNEENSKISSWRVKIDVMVNYPRLLEKVESIMRQITLKTRVDENFDGKTAETDESKIIE